MPIIAHHQRSRTDRCPDIAVRSLLADRCLVLEPDFYRCAWDCAVERRAHVQLPTAAEPEEPAYGLGLV